MRRSEMVERMAFFLSDFHGEKAIPGTYDYLADKLLEFVEEEGMHPPGATFTSTNKNSKWFGVSIDQAEWEDEE